MDKNKIAAKNKKLLKSLGINVRNLQSYHIMWGTTPYTFGYKESSMWAYSINPILNTVEVNTTYFKLTDKIKKHNNKILKNNYETN